MRIVTLLGCLLAPWVWAQTSVKGTLPGNTTWTLSGSPYLMTGDVNIPSGTTLTIEPGVTVQASTSDAESGGESPTRVELIVRGTLVVQGTQAQPVTFTANGSKRAWYGIRVLPTSSGTTVAGAVIEKSERAFSAYAPAIVRNTTLRQSYDGCLLVWGGAVLTVTGSVLDDCGPDAAYVDSDSGNLLMDTTVVKNSGTDNASTQGGFAVVVLGKATLHHNTIVNNLKSGVVFDGSEYSGAALTLRDNIIANNGSRGLYRYDSSGVLVYEYNNVFGHTSNTMGAVGGSQNISADPQFVGSSDFRLQATSPSRGAGSNGSDQGAFPYVAAVASVSVTPGSVNLSPGNTQAFTATPKDAAGNTVPGTVSWSVVAGGGTITPAGEFTAGNTAGSFSNTVRASVDGVSGFASVTVAQAPPATVVIAPASATLAPNGATTFTAQVKDANNNVLAVPVSWSVLNPQAGTITPGGVFTAGATPGSYPAVVRATAGAVSATADVTINNNALSQLIITPATTTVQAGKKVGFTVVGKDAAGTNVPVSATWSVVKGGGSVDNSGLFTAGTVPGSYLDTVQASAQGLAATATVVVQPGPVTQVNVTPAQPALQMGEKKQFAAVAKDPYGNEVPSLTFVWKADGRAGSIDDQGMFTAGNTPGEYPDSVVAEAQGFSGAASVRVLGLSPGTDGGQPLDGGEASDAGSEVADAGVQQMQHLAASPQGCNSVGEGALALLGLVFLTLLRRR